MNKAGDPAAPSWALAAAAGNTMAEDAPLRQEEQAWVKRDGQSSATLKENQPLPSCFGCPTLAFGRENGPFICLARCLLLKVY